MKKIVLWSAVLFLVCGCVDSPKNCVPCPVPYERRLLADGLLREARRNPPPLVQRHFVQNQPS